MSIALERSGGGGGGGGGVIQGSGFVHGMRVFAGQQQLSVVKRREVGEEGLEDSCSSSSIGRNSDASGDEGSGEDCGEKEVQSSYRGPLETMDALEEVLSIKKGISKFYNGKSKSFTSLADASSASSIKDLAKPENPYTKKRKNLLTHKHFSDKSQSYPPRDHGGISKRLTNSNRDAMALGSNTKKNGEASQSISMSPSFCLPPMHPHGKGSPSSGWSPLVQRNPPLRSFSLSDLKYGEMS